MKHCLPSIRNWW